MCPSWQAPCGAAKPSRLGPDPGILASPPPLRPSLSPPLRIIFSTPLAIIAYFLIWFVPDFKQGQALWYLLFYCLFETLVTVSVGTSPGCLGGLWGGAVPGASGLVPEATFVCPSSDWPRASLPCQCFHVPYSALTMFISTEQSERDSATAYRKFPQGTEPTHQGPGVPHSLILLPHFFPWAPNSLLLRGAEKPS